MRINRLTQLSAQFMGTSYPKYKGVATSVDIYGTNTCPYCIRAKMMFSSIGAPYKFINLSGDKEKRQQLSKQYNWDTVPMIVINGKFEGGFSDVQQKIQKGELEI